MKKKTFAAALAIATISLTITTNIANADNLNQTQFIAAAPNPALNIEGALPTRIDNSIKIGDNRYRIDPQAIINKIGWAKFKEFYLKNGDIGELNFNNIDTFINFVEGKTEINGILNSVRDGKHYDGNAIFISKGGFTVGKSGVINVGALGVQAPNANINIDGKVFAKNGINLDGKKVTVNGYMLNGINDMQYLQNNDQADRLFNNLVNVQDKQFIGSAFTHTANGGIKITSEKGIKTGENSVIANKNSAGTVIFENNGANGTKLNGLVLSNTPHELSGDIIVNNNAGNLKVGSNSALVAGNNIYLNNSGKNLILEDGAKIGNAKDIIRGDGYYGDSSMGVFINQKGTGKLLSNASITTKSAISFTNETGSSMRVGGTLKTEEGGDINFDNQNGDLHINAYLAPKAYGNIYRQTSSVIINNQAKDSKLYLNGNIEAKNVRINNYGNGGLQSKGNISSVYDTNIENRAGKLTIDGDILARKANIINEENAKELTLTKNSKITTEELNINNQSEKGMTINGTIGYYNRQSDVIPGEVPVHKITINQYNNGDVKINGKITSPNPELEVNVQGNGNLSIGKIFEINEKTINELTDCSAKDSIKEPERQKPIEEQNSKSSNTFEQKEIITVNPEKELETFDLPYEIKPVDKIFTKYDNFEIQLPQLRPNKEPKLEQDKVAELTIKPIEKYNIESNTQIKNSNFKTYETFYLETKDQDKQ